MFRYGIPRKTSSSEHRPEEPPDVPDATGNGHILQVLGFGKEGHETLTVSELNIQTAAVAFDAAESMVR